MRVFFSNSICENMFYAGQEKYGIISAKPAKPKYLHEFRNEIAGYDDKLSKLHKQQFDAMIYGRENELNELEKRAAAKKAQNSLWSEYNVAMGTEDGGAGYWEQPRWGNNIKADSKDRPEHMHLVTQYPKGQSPFDKGSFDWKDRPGYINPVIQYPKGQSPFGEGIIDYGSEIASINAREDDISTGIFSGSGGGGSRVGGSWGPEDETNGNEPANPNDALEGYAKDTAVGAMPFGEIYAGADAATTIVKLGQVPEQVKEDRAALAANIIAWGNYVMNGSEGPKPELLEINGKAPTEEQKERYKGAYKLIISTEQAWSKYDEEGNRVGDMYDWDKDFKGKTYDQLPDELKIFIDENIDTFDSGGWLQSGLDRVMDAIE